MKKPVSLILAMLAILFAVSCKSAPAAEPEPEPVPVQEHTDTRFTNAYEAVLPILYDGAQNYTIAAGDTLTRISRKFYGRRNAFFFPFIMAASKDKRTVDIVDPDLIEPGMELVVPDLELNLAQPEIKARIKTLLDSVSKIYREKPDTNWSFEIRDGLAATAGTL
ncbi:MAG: LysM peptidoglycan-binding domain-containing protein [Spirochaetaceae bacterium]|jgi:LysM repeat protein|nr:LysM peptidoglycan-binding domain-containing protein [Spirochaetaceae bacterium]